MRAHRTGEERGSATLELAVLAPAVLALLGLVVVGARVASVHQAVDQAAGDAARAATLARIPAAATAAATAAARADLGAQHLCQPWAVHLSGALVPGGTMTAHVTCTTTFGVLPGGYTASASQSSAVDTYRGVSQ